MSNGLRGEPLAAARTFTGLNLAKGPTPTREKVEHRASEPVVPIRGPARRDRQGMVPPCLSPFSKGAQRGTCFHTEARHIAILKGDDRHIAGPCLLCRVQKMRELFVAYKRVPRKLLNENWFETLCPMGLCIVFEQCKVAEESGVELHEEFR